MKFWNAIYVFIILQRYWNYCLHKILVILQSDALISVECVLIVLLVKLTDATLAMMLKEMQ